MSVRNVLNDSLELCRVGKYRFVEKDGMVYRIGENGVEFPPISRKEFNKIAKAREEAFGIGTVLKSSESKLKEAKNKSSESAEERND